MKPILRAPALAITYVILCSFFTVSVASAQAWRGSGRAKGVVQDPAGKPIEGASVTAIWAENEGGGPAAVKTDAKGRWSFIGLTAGDWKLDVSANGFQPFTDDFVVYAQGAPDTLRATLQPIPKEVIESQLESQRLEAINASLAEGNRLAQAGEFEAARAAYQKALEQVDADKKAEVLAGIASTYVQEQKLDEGKSYLDQALVLDGKNETALRLMVAVLAAQGKDEEAKKYLALLPDDRTLDPSTQLNLGIMRYNEGKLAEAGEIFDRVLSTHPDRAEAYYFSGLVHLNQERHSVALERFEKFLELAPDDAKAAEARQFVEHLRAQAAKSG